MQINLTEILRLIGCQKHFPVDLQMETFKVAEEDYVIIEKPQFDLLITNMGDKQVQIEGEFNINIMFHCDRCMCGVPYEMNVAFVKSVNMNETDESRVRDLNEMSYISGYILDVEKLVYDEMVIHFPMKILCNDDCKGICNKCGANLNDTDCGCETTQIDLRMANILDIFNKSKEV